jgi:hypothetical protein
VPPQLFARLWEFFGRVIFFKGGNPLAVTLLGQPPVGLADEVKKLLHVARFSSYINTLPSR